MQRLKYKEKLDQVPIPADRFDLIGGTSTGGFVSATTVPPLSRADSPALLRYFLEDFVYPPPMQLEHTRLSPAKSSRSKNQKGKTGHSKPPSLRKQSKM